MKKWPVCLILFTVTFPGLLQAEETTRLKLQFAIKLRESNRPKLALEYLEKKLGRNPPKEMRDLISLEIARTRLAMVHTIPFSERLSFLEKARKDYLQFSRKSNTSLEKYTVSWELAKVTFLEGKTYVGQAFQQKNLQVQRKLIDLARNRFEKSEQELISIVASVQKEMKKFSPKEPMWRKLRKIHLQCLFDIGNCKLYQSNTILDITSMENIVRKTKLVDNARELFVSVYKDVLKKDGKVDLELSHLAIAHVILTYQMEDSPDKAAKLYNRLMIIGDNRIEKGQRYASYFWLKGVAKNPGIKNKLDFSIQMGEQWLKRYRNHRNSEIGYGVQFVLAMAYFNKAKSIVRKENQPELKQLFKNKAARPFADAAMRLFSNVAKSQSNRTLRARQLFETLSELKKKTES